MELRIAQDTDAMHVGQISWHHPHPNYFIYAN